MPKTVLPQLLSFAAFLCFIWSVSLVRQNKQFEEDMDDHIFKRIFNLCITKMQIWKYCKGGEVGGNSNSQKATEADLFEMNHDIHEACEWKRCAEENKSISFLRSSS